MAFAGPWPLSPWVIARHEHLRPFGRSLVALLGVAGKHWDGMGISLISYVVQLVYFVPDLARQCLQAAKYALKDTPTRN